MKNPLSRIALILPMGLATFASAQEPVVPAPVTPAPAVIPGEFLVHFAKPVVDLEGLRAAIAAKASIQEVDRIVAGLEETVARERAAFVQRIKALGGQVLENYWIIDVSYLRLPGATLGSSKIKAIKALPGVSRIEPNLLVAPTLGTSTNANNHNSDAANLKRGLTAGQLVVGTGLTVAILDTGIDANMNSIGRPHRSYFRNGDPANKTGGGLGGSRLLGRFVARFASGNGEDDNFHGSAVASCSAGARWPGNDAGFAPDARIVSWKVSSASNGGASIAAITDAWQQALSNVARYKIVAANNSYSGSPSMTSSAAQASDRLAYIGNVNVCVPSGNSGSNVSATQPGYNALSCGSNNKNSSSRSSFSGFGTQGSGKVIPDIMAVGASLIMTRRDTESFAARASGTSFSSPSVAGAAVLVRHANPKLGALEAKALLLNHTRAASGGSGRGAGILRADLAVNAAIAGKVSKGKLDATKTSSDFFFPLTQGVRHSVTLTWFRKTTSSSQNNNLSLSVFDASNNLVASSNRSGANSYEKVEFIPAKTGTYRARVDGTRVDSSVDYAIAGAGKATPPKKPKLTAISPAKTPIRSSGLITLTGRDLQGVTDIFVGSLSVPAQNAKATSVQFAAPSPTALGPIAIKARSGGGDSNVLMLSYIGNHPPVFEGSGILISNGFYTDNMVCDQGWIGIHFISGSNKPSKLAAVVNLGIGDAFKNLILLNTFLGDKVGQQKQSWIMPAGFGGKTFYSQLIAVDGKTLKLPFESSNVLVRRVLF